MTEPLLHTRDLNKRFGAVHATRDLNFAVRAGEIHALIGPNGAGKSTAIAQFSGTIAADSGQIRFAGEDITNLPEHGRARRGLTRSFQITSLFENMTALDNVALAVQATQGHSYRFWRDARRDPRRLTPALATLRRLGLESRADMPARRLAHGEKRQLEIAMALAVKPRLLLLDEPMAGMGPGGAVKLTELLASLRGELTMVLVEHDMQAVFALADRITVLVNGGVLTTAPADEVRQDPRVRMAYLGE